MSSITPNVTAAYQANQTEGFNKMPRAHGKNVPACYLAAKIGNLELLKLFIAQGCDKESALRYSEKKESKQDAKGAQLQEKLDSCQEKAIFEKICSLKKA